MQYIPCVGHHNRKSFCNYTSDTSLMLNNPRRMANPAVINHTTSLSHSTVDTISKWQTDWPRTVLIDIRLIPHRFNLIGGLFIVYMNTKASATTAWQLKSVHRNDDDICAGCTG